MPSTESGPSAVLLGLDRSFLSRVTLTAGMRTAIQLYSLRDVSAPLAEVVERMGQMGYEGVEFAYRLADADEEAVRDVLDAADVTAAGAHVPLERFEDVESVADTYAGLGCETLVVPYLDESHFESRGAVERAAARLTDVGERLADRGIDFGYHNHTHEFVPLEDGTAYEVLAAATPTTVDLQVDVGLAALAGQDPVALVERYGDRITQLHCKDYDLEAERSVDLGNGDVDVAGCLDAAREAGVEWAIVEFEDSEDPFESAERSLAAQETLR